MRKVGDWGQLYMEACCLAKKKGKDVIRDFPKPLDEYTSQELYRLIEEWRND